MKKYITLVLVALLLAGCSVAPADTTKSASTSPIETTIPIPEVTICTEEHDPWIPVQNYFEAYRTGVGTDFQNYAPAEYWSKLFTQEPPAAWEAHEPWPVTVEQWRARFEKNTAAMIGGPKGIYGEDYTVTLTLKSSRYHTEELQEEMIAALEKIGIARERFGTSMILKMDVCYAGSVSTETIPETFSVMQIDGRWYWGGPTYDGDIEFQFPH